MAYRWRSLFARAEVCFQKGLDVARSRQTKMLELRAATSMANLYLGAGHLKEAFDLLGTIYSWFGEGLTSRDMLDAGNLLVRLSGLL
jgi:hypothetical protein